MPPVLTLSGHVRVVGHRHEPVVDPVSVLSHAGHQLGCVEERIGRRGGRCVHVGPQPVQAGLGGHGGQGHIARNVCRLVPGEHGVVLCEPADHTLGTSEHISD